MLNDQFFSALAAIQRDLQARLVYFLNNIEMQIYSKARTITEEEITDYLENSVCNEATEVLINLVLDSIPEDKKETLCTLMGATDFVKASVEELSIDFEDDSLWDIFRQFLVNTLFSMTEHNAKQILHDRGLR